MSIFLTLLIDHHLLNTFLCEVTDVFRDENDSSEIQKVLTECVLSICGKHERAQATTVARRLGSDGSN